MSAHPASLKTSHRLRRLLSCLRQFPGGLTTRQLQKMASVCAVATSISEIRRQGIVVTCKLLRVEPNGAKVFQYKLGN